jgi:hypothetical protein
MPVPGDDTSATAELSDAEIIGAVIGTVVGFVLLCTGEG